MIVTVDGEAVGVVAVADTDKEVRLDCCLVYVPVFFPAIRGFER